MSFIKTNGVGLKKKGKINYIRISTCFFLTQNINCTIYRDQRVLTICLDCQSKHSSTRSATAIFALHLLETGKNVCQSF